MIVNNNRPVHLRIACGGQNWMNVASAVAVGLTGYDSPLPWGSTVAPVSSETSKAWEDGPKGVADGRFDMAITTPMWNLRMAIEGSGRFSEPLPLRLLAAFPHDDQLALAVRAETGITSLADIVEGQYPLKVSMPRLGSNIGVGWVLEKLFSHYGVAPGDLARWGGEILTDRPVALNSASAAMVDPRFDAIFDEALNTRRWRRLGEEHDLRFLEVDDEAMATCAEWGLERAYIRKGRVPGVDRDIPSIDFDGWALFCHADLPDDLAYLTVRGLHRQARALNGRFTGEFAAMTSPWTIEHIAEVADARIPIHPGALAYYHEQDVDLGEVYTDTPRSPRSLFSMSNSPLDVLRPVPSFTLTSPDLDEGGTLADAQVSNQMGLSGGNTSPALAWSGFPEGTKSFAVFCFDPDAPTMSGFWHWAVLDLPPGVTGLPAGAGRSEGLPAGFHLRNDNGTFDFTGAAPPPGDPAHRYLFVVLALDVPSAEVQASASPAYAMYNLGFQTIGRAVLTGWFGR